MKAEAIRSLLFVPADREDRIRKAYASAADAVVLDLEDAVAPERKGYARDLARALLAEAPADKAVFVRVNAFDTALTALDAASVTSAQPFGLMLPKAEGLADLWRLSHMLDALEARDGIAPGSLRILSIATETAAAVLALAGAGRAAEVPPRLWGLLWGGEDLSAALAAQSNREPDGGYTQPFQFARTQCLYAAHAWGVMAVDAVHTDFRDLAALETETRQALRDGFSAKAAIHPAQLEVINRVLTPAPEQLDWARQVVSLLESQGVARLDGRMIDIAHKRLALRLLARAAAFGAAE